ncbi:hypothetical protein ACIHAX_20765 [Nocardia sp. NPDC051929]|uniref:hypothetical protein n=1 Tax=Nocardia sp. NPDC051929 TaxID=3364327 RepID=UPI0037C9B9EE
MPRESTTSTISAALHAARAVIGDNDAEAIGLVIVLLREGCPVTVLRQPRREVDLATITAAARSASARFPTTPTTCSMGDVIDRAVL